jgi:hypothetical protein
MEGGTMDSLRPMNPFFFLKLDFRAYKIAFVIKIEILRMR